ncbi:MAG: hypothetical protein WC938_03790 [Candidatus Paceibacterota bacterium]|jgi:hypothetical protein
MKDHFEKPDNRDLYEKLGDWDMLPVWLRWVLILAIPIILIMAIALGQGE